MSNSNTIFLALIAAVLLGATVVWPISQPSAAERRAIEMQERLDPSTEALDRLREAEEACALIGC